MKQFKKLVACLLAAVLALAMFSACGRVSLNIQYDEAKKSDAAAALAEYMEQADTFSMTADAKMEKAAHDGLEPAIAYLCGKMSKQESAIEIWTRTGMNLDDLQACYDEHRFIRIVIPESEYSYQAVQSKLQSEMAKVNAATAPTKYGMEAATYEGNVYIAMFMM